MSLYIYGIHAMPMFIRLGCSNIGTISFGLRGICRINVLYNPFSDWRHFERFDVVECKTLIDRVSLMAPYLLWRAIGGTLMWFSHLVFAFNKYKMIWPRRIVNINEEALEKLALEDHELVDVQ